MNPSADDDEVELELAKEQPVRIESEYALAPDEAREAAVESHRNRTGADDDASEADDYSVSDAAPKIDVGPAINVGPMSPSSPVKPSSTMRPTTRPPTAAQRQLKKFTKNPTLMLAAAIIVGGIAAIIVGKLVLWLLQPAPKPKSRYGAVPTHDTMATASLIGRPIAQAGSHVVRECFTDLV